jgi:hypothetical protein
LDEVVRFVALDGSIDRGCILVTFLLPALRFWPANRVSGEAVRRGVDDLEEVGEAKFLIGRGGDDGVGSFKRSLSDIFGPEFAICQGDDVLPSAFSTDTSI